VFFAFPWTAKAQRANAQTKNQWTPTTRENTKRKTKMNEGNSNSFPRVAKNRFLLTSTHTHRKNEENSRGGVKREEPSETSEPVKNKSS